MKSCEQKSKPRKSEKTNVSSKKLGLESLFQKTEVMNKKRKNKDEMPSKG